MYLKQQNCKRKEASMGENTKNFKVAVGAMLAIIVAAGVSNTELRATDAHWTDLEGKKKSHDHSCSSQRLKLNERYGIIANSWEKIPIIERKKIIAVFQSVVKKYE